jgi:transcriptional regulator with XRE-family HTH domain
MSQDDLAYEAEISRSYLSQIEKGTFFASLKKWASWLRLPGVEPAELLKLPMECRAIEVPPARLVCRCG